MHCIIVVLSSEKNFKYITNTFGRSVVIPLYVHVFLYVSCLLKHVYNILYAYYKVRQGIFKIFFILFKKKMCYM